MRISDWSSDVCSSDLGKPVETPATLLNSLKGVTVDDKPVKPPAPARLFIFHKPSGVLTAANDPKGRPTIYNRLPDGLPRPMPVGRLDLNNDGRSEGQTSQLQSRKPNSDAGLCWKKKKQNT